MRLRANQQLFLSYLALIAVLTLMMSVGADSLLRRHLLRTIEEDLRRELVLARALYENTPQLGPDSAATLIGTLTERRVTIVDAAGQLLGDSRPDARVRPDVDDYRTRPEIIEAMNGEQGRAIRWSAPLGAEFLYLAIPARQGEVIRLALPLAEINNAVLRVQRGIFGIGVAAVLLAGLFSLVFSTLVTRELRRIVEVAGAIAAGDLSRRIRLRREDELGELAQALNVLADELQRRLGQLEGERAEMQALIDSMSEGVLALSPTGTLRRANPAARRIFALGPARPGIPPEMVSRRPDFLRLVALALGGQTVPPRELNSDGQSLLATAHPLPDGGAVLVFLDISELRRLEGVRRDFVANASHELKTPLTAIRGYSETLLDPDLPPDLTRRFAEIVKDNADRLQRIVDDLLDLSRIEAGGWRIDPAETHVGRLAAEAWTAQRSVAAGNEIMLELDLTPGHETVFADPDALRQVLTNLFSNAIRYTPPGGRVTVRTRAAPARPGWSRPGASQPAPGAPGGWTLVEVQDTGSGIPTAHLSRIFERFYRVDPARSREEGGTGLGLAIVRHLVEAHGGWTDAQSRVGEGTTIRFVLPSAPGGEGAK